MLFIKPQFPFKPNTLSLLYKKEIIFDVSKITIGFVVNIYDPVNFDIDIEVDDEYRENLKNANISSYFYNEYINFEKTKNLQKGTIYRCRIYGIGVDRQKKSDIKNIPLLNKLKKKVDELDGWIICEIKGIDNYSRLLINLYLPKYNEDKKLTMIDIKDLILEKDYFFLL